MDEFTPEFHLLLQLLRSALAGDVSTDSPPSTREIDWATFVAIVQRHRVGALLYRRAAAQLAAQCPEAVTQQLRAIAEKNTQRALAQSVELIRIIRCLETADVVAMPVKGLALAEQLYGAIGVRFVGDIDLLIRPEDAVRADVALRSTGLRRTIPVQPLTPRQTQEFLLFPHGFGYQRDAPAQRIEMHWGLQGLPDADTVWLNASSGTICGHPVRTFSPNLNALYLFQHGAQHGWFRLFWLFDVALVLRNPEIDWEKTVLRARELGLERALLQGAALAYSLLGVATPNALQPRPKERRIVAALVTEALRQIARDPIVYLSIGEWIRSYVIYKVRLHRNRRAKFAFIAPILSSPANWETVSLPDRWFFLYPILSPFLWIGRGVSRAIRHRLDRRIT